jgi:hypothetical protein
MRSKGV